MNYGFHLPFPDVRLHAARPWFERLVELGYTDCWSAEADAQDGVTPLAVASVWVPTMRLGTSILPVFTRGPALLAMTAATMADAAPGRFLLGVGTSSRPIVERWNAVPFVEPYKRTRDVVRFLRRALTGERIDEEFDTFSVRGFTLGRPPEVPPKILVAALRQRMLELAGREADGTILNWLSAEDVAKVVPYVGPDKEVVCKIMVCVDPDPEVFPTLARRMIATYLNVDVYHAYHEWLGRGSALEGMWSAWASGDRKGALGAIPDEVVDELVVSGSVGECRARIQRFVAAGATTPVIGLLPCGMPVGEAIEALAPANDLAAA
jgi:probable F420-dependent oxidoreductase